MELATVAEQCAAACRSHGLIHGDVVQTWQYRAEYGYPVPTLDRDAALANLQSELADRQIYSRGRFGAWKYEVGNMDHSYMQGREVIDHLLQGTQEITLHNPIQVNSRKSA